MQFKCKNKFILVLRNMLASPACRLLKLLRLHNRDPLQAKLSSVPKKGDKARYHIMGHMYGEDLNLGMTLERVVKGDPRFQEPLDASSPSDFQHALGKFVSTAEPAKPLHAPAESPKATAGLHKATAGPTQDLAKLTEPITELSKIPNVPTEPIGEVVEGYVGAIEAPATAVAPAEVTKTFAAAIQVGAQAAEAPAVGKAPTSRAEGAGGDPGSRDHGPPHKVRFLMAQHDLIQPLPRFLA